MKFFDQLLRCHLATPSFCCAVIDRHSLEVIHYAVSDRDQLYGLQSCLFNICQVIINDNE